MQAGTRLGSYEILSLLGKGGMGEVWCARDTKLRRDVAIKVLPDAVAREPEQLARFRREARAQAALNHPNISAIYGLEESGPVHFLVLELVEGDTLAELLAGGPLPLRESLQIGVQIAGALEAAHDKGIMHRDLKPANIKITDEGQVKVLDFGLAKAFSGEESESDAPQTATLTETVETRKGSFVGTPAYMSPEQARRQQVDKRTDTWAFGCVLYQMLSGERPFAGVTVTDTIARIIERDPDWDALPDETPSRIRDLLERCMEKNLRNRQRDIGDVRIELERAASESPRSDETTASPRGRRSLIPVGLAVVTASVITGLVVGYLPSPTPEPLLRASIELSTDQRLFGRNRQALALSPDGQQVVYVATTEQDRRLYLRSLDQTEAVPLPGTSGATSPFFAPDGQSIGFFVGNQLMRVGIDGGEPLTIGPAPGPDYMNMSASWTEDGTILFASGSGLVQISANGGIPRPLTTLDQGEILHAHPSMLPGGQAVLFNVSRRLNPSNWDIVAQAVDTGERRVVVEGGSSPRYLASGHIVFARNGTLMAVRFDVGRLEVSGDPVVVVESVMHAQRGGNDLFNTGAAHFSVSEQGRLVYVHGGVYPMAVGQLLWVDRSGENIHPLPLAQARRYYPRISPDGSRIAYAEGPGGEAQIWVYDLELEVQTRLTSEGQNRFPVWSPDGTRIVLSSDIDGRMGNLHWMAADGSGRMERLTETTAFQVPASWSIDGVLAFVETGVNLNFDVMTLSIKDDSEPRPFLDTEFDETYPAFSPDGDWLAYTSNESGGDEVYVRPFPAGERAFRISTDSGHAPLWSPDGRQLYYFASGNRKMVVDVTTDPAFTRSRPRPLFVGAYQSGAVSRNYDMHPDGQGFLMGKSARLGAERVTSIRIVENWFEELRERVPVP